MASEVDISTLPMTTQRIIVLGSSIYLAHRLVVISSMLSGWSEPFTGTLVIPGKSTKLKSGTFLEYTVRIIGLSIIPLLLPASFSVNYSIFRHTSEKSSIFSSLLLSNIEYGLSAEIEWISLSSRGLLVHIPYPLGKKS